MGLSLVDVIRAADFQARHLLLALRSGDQFRIARALALEVGHKGLEGGTVETKVLELLETTRAVAAGLSNPYPAVLAEMVAGALGWLNGRWKRSLERSDAAERWLIDQCGAPAWEVTSTRIFSMAALLWMGDLTEHRRRLPGLVREARERGNLFAEVSIPLLGYAHLARLADDEPQAALEEVDRLAAAWATNRFDLQRFWVTYARAEIRLYQGDGRAAWREVSSVAKDVRRSLLLRGQTMRISWGYLVARCALAAARDGERQQLRVAARIARQLAKEPVAWAAPLAAALQAALSSSSGDREGAAAQLERAERGFFGADMTLHGAAAAAARARRTGTAPPAAARAVFERESVARPEGIERVLIPHLAS
jgi:hypothetical protein